MGWWKLHFSIVLPVRTEILEAKFAEMTTIRLTVSTTPGKRIYAIVGVQRHLRQ